MGFIQEGLKEAERAHRLNALDPMSANQLAFARMAAGRLEEARPVYEERSARVPDVSFPVSKLPRVYAFQQDWAEVDHRLMDLGEQRQLREFQETVPFVRSRRNPTPENTGAWKRALEVHHPAQVYCPEWISVYCEHGENARSTRKKILAQAADSGARVVPAHFGGCHYAWI